MSGAPSGATTTTTTTTGGDAGNVSNIGGASSVSGDTLPGDTSTTDTSISDTSLTKGEVPNTGGEPQIMLMAGLVLAACGLLLRRKMAGQAV